MATEGQTQLVSRPIGPTMGHPMTTEPSIRPTSISFTPIAPFPPIPQPLRQSRQSSQRTRHVWQYPNPYPQIPTSSQTANWLQRPMWLDSASGHPSVSSSSRSMRQRSLMSRSTFNNRAVRRLPSTRATMHKQPLHLPVGTSPFDTFVRRYFAQITRGCVQYLLDPHSGKCCTNMFCASNPHSPYRNHPHVASQLAVTLAQCGVRFMCSTLAFNLIRSRGKSNTKRLTKSLSKSVIIPAAPLSRKRRHPSDALDQAILSIPQHWSVQTPVVKKLKTRCDNSFVPFEEPVPSFPADMDPDAGILTEPKSTWKALEKFSSMNPSDISTRTLNPQMHAPLSENARQEGIQDIVEDRGYALEMSCEGSASIPVTGINLPQFKYLFTRCNPRSKADMTAMGDLLFFIFSRPKILANSFQLEGQNDLDLVQVTQFYDYLVRECPRELGSAVVAASSSLLQHIALGLDIVDNSNGHIFVTLLANPLLSSPSVEAATILSQVFQVIVDMPHGALVRFCSVLMRFCSNGTLDLRKFDKMFPIDLCVKQPETSPHAFVHAHAKYQDSLRGIKPDVDRALKTSDLRNQFSHLVTVVQNVITTRLSRCQTVPSPVSDSGFDSDDMNANPQGIFPSPATPPPAPTTTTTFPPMDTATQRVSSESNSTNTTPFLTSAGSPDSRIPIPRTATPDPELQSAQTQTSQPSLPHPVTPMTTIPGPHPIAQGISSPDRPQSQPVKLLRPHEDHGLLAAIKFAYILYQLNDALGILPYVSFYNDALNESLSIKEDFPRWKTGEGISFCHYPFLLNPAVKSDILRVESIVHMRHELQDAFFRAMFQGMSSPYIILAVRRTHVVSDALYQLGAMAPQDLRKQLRIQFVGEEAVDKGGVQKEFFHLVVREVCDPKYGMFQINDESQRCWFANSTVMDKHALTEYRLLGKLIGLAILNSVFLAVHFPVALYKKLMGVKPDISDLEELDPLLVKGLRQLLEFEGTDEEFEEAFPCTFVVDQPELFGETVEVPLCPGGESTQLNKRNRENYVDLYVDWVLNHKVEQQFGAFKEGFDAVTKGTAISLFRPEELEQLVCGGNVLDFAELEGVTQYDGYSKESQVIQYFWDVVRDFTPDQQKRLLFFTTGSDRCPIGGVKRLQFIIARNGPHSDRLPTSHTCFNVLLLCEYQDKETLRNRLLTAIHNAEGFGLM